MVDNTQFKPDSDLKLMDQVRQVLRHYNYSYNTEKIYCGWIINYIKFFNVQPYSSAMEGKEIEVFLNHLSIDKKVSPATQKQALNSLLFLYKKVLFKKAPESLDLIKPQKISKLPGVLKQEEILLILSQMKRTHLLMSKLLYGCGLRLMECLRLRIQDINFSSNEIYIRALKNGKDRIAMLPQVVREDLLVQKEHVREIHKSDLQNGYGAIDLPESMTTKSETSVRSFAFQYLFPAKKTSKDPRTGKIRRNHVIESGIQKAVKNAGFKAGFTKQITCQMMRNSFATHMLENGVNVKTVQKLMGHSNLNMTKVFMKLMDKEPPPLKSPLDTLMKTH